MRSITAIIGLVMVGAVALGACGDDDDDESTAAPPSTVVAVTTTIPATTTPATTAAPTGDAAGLDGQRFTAPALKVAGAERPAAGGSTFTISFAGGSVVAEAGCNAMRGDFRIEGDTLVVGTMVGTRKGCSAELEEQDQLLSQLLSGSPTVTVADGAITLTGDTITFTGTAA